ncbi:MAG: hypothetical protein ACYS8K_00910, partial [Planctomycetota bacterium]
HEIGLAIALWCVDHDSQYPPDLEVLVSERYLEDEWALSDPADEQPVQRGEKGYPYSYEYVGAIPVNTPAQTIICYTRNADMGVEFVSEAALRGEEEGGRSTLRESYEAVVAAYGEELTEKRRAELKAFYEVAEAEPTAAAAE